MYNKDNMIIITTHINADFDAVASLLAAQKLYPEALVVFPGANDRTLNNFFVNTISYLLNMADIKDIDFAKVIRLVLVDTRHSSRIGKFAEILQKSELEIHLYDHHPLDENDIKCDYEVHKLTGANVTILVDILRDKNIYISAEEATIMCLGIFEDTGFFTFPSTTKEDFLAAAWLLSKGANLNTISSLISREMTHAQITLLNDMLQAAVSYIINGIEVIVTTVSAKNYVPDFSFLAFKILKMKDADAAFAIARMKSKIYVVARSRISEVDSGAIVSSFGGGGHRYAASATIKGKTIVQVEQEILELLHKKIKSARLAKNIMSSPPITTAPDVSCKEASKLLAKYNINALLITAKESGHKIPVGFISRQIIEKALYHDLGNLPVSEYMTDEIVFVEFDADIFEIQTKILKNNQRILPVMKDKELVGVITRTDLFDSLVRHFLRKYKNNSDSFVEKIAPKSKNIIRFMEERLSYDIFNILKIIGKTAYEIGFCAYVVGGFVRDLFLYRDIQDIDIVIEGDGIAFAQRLSRKMGVRVHAHEKFGTAVIIFPDNFKIDVASARLEYYKSPAALPEVEMSSIKFDLRRRDFTINTLAIQISPEKFGTLIDFFGARRDIKEKRIRVLHNLSFVEDPTRVFRAILFEQRFGFTMGKLTSGLIKNAVRMEFFKRLSGKRVFSELKYILKEEDPILALIRLNDYGLIMFIEPNIRFNKKLIELFASVKSVISWHDLLFVDESYSKWAVYFLALISQCSQEVSEEICVRFEIESHYRILFCEKRFNAEKTLFKLLQGGKIKNSVLYRYLFVFKTELILYIMAKAKNNNVKKLISNYYIKLRYIKVSITGRDLQNMGFKPSPVFSNIMDAILDAKLNGFVKTREDELNYIKKLEREKRI